MQDVLESEGKMLTKYEMLISSQKFDHLRKRISETIKRENCRGMEGVSR